ncbi:TonB-dependent receptor plug domain-containing protein [Geomesophilobacter sediminis]|uniref:TonB-dependent receptor n=1 Tax=Geomesophilobacter sediminis TaxID=2798584 RepID=A0A8J7JEQ5_9BACT|nr:TonB-dependent receptor [Geomesophilobacter sediminis]MBJ6725781.1 TonB-dependent receptor [Geomesophilobacter sediminis]
MANSLASATSCRLLAAVRGVAACTLFLLGLSALPEAARAETVPAEDQTDYLSLGLEDLMKIEITSVSKKSQPLADAAAAVFVITHEDIRRSGATSIAEVLRMAPGVQVARIDANKWAISIRGLNGRFANKLLVLMDGRSLYSPLFAGVYWEMQDTVLEDIDRIEVIRGPGAALWGANAVNGVINIITRSAEHTNGGMVSTGGGTEARDFVTARYGFALSDTTHLRLFAKHQDTADSVYSDGTRAHDSWQTSRGGFRLDSQPNARDSFTVSGDYYNGTTNERYTLYRLPTLADPSLSTIANVESQMSGGDLLLRWNRSLGETDGFSLQLYYDHSERNMIILGHRQEIVDVEFQDRVALPGRQDLIWGGEYRYAGDRLGATATISFDPPSRDTNLFSGFIHDEIKIVPEKFSVILGTRFEHNSYSGFELQPNGRLLWTPTPTDSVWAAVSRAVRTPARGDSDIVYRYHTYDPAVFGTTPFPLRAEIDGNKDFRAETLVAYELGYRTQPRQHLTLDSTVFYNVYDRLRVLRAETALPVFEPANNDLVQRYLLDNLMHGFAYGAEVAAEWAPFAWWRLHASYSYLKIKMFLDAPSTDLVNKRDAEGDSPRHQFSLRSGLDLGKNVELDLWLRGVDELPYIDGSVISGYLTMDARLAWKPTPKLELSVVGQNLLQRRHQEFNPEFINTLPTDVQRSVYGKVTWKF